MQHFWIAEHDVRTTADRATGVLRRIAVVGKCADLLSVDSQAVGQGVQLGQRVLRERLCRKQIQRAGRRLVENRAENGDVVAQRLAGDCRCNDGDMAPFERMGDRLGLVRVRAVNASLGEHLAEPVVNRRRERTTLRLSSGDDARCRDDLGHTRRTDRPVRTVAR